MTGLAMVKDHRPQGKPQQRGRWSWAFMRRDLYDGPGQKCTPPTGSRTSSLAR